MDSHAIITYLVTKYGGTKHASLCPADAFLRAKIDHRLHFESSVLYVRFGKLFGPVFRGTDTELDEENKKSMLEAIDSLEAFLAHGDYLTGNHLTVADFPSAVTVALLILFLKLDAATYPKVLAWSERLSKLPYYAEIMTPFLEGAFKMISEKLNANKK